MRRNRRLQLDGETWMTVREHKELLFKASRRRGAQRSQLRHMNEKLAYYKLKFGPVKTPKKDQQQPENVHSIVSKDQAVS